jgi:hypothetical protein
MTEWAMRCAPADSRDARLACWLALQTALAVPLASLPPRGSPVRRMPRPRRAPCRSATGVGAVPRTECPPRRSTRDAINRSLPCRWRRQRRRWEGRRRRCALGIKTPTTAEPGTLVPGGRRQTLTFADFGALDPLQLRGTDGQNGVPFSVRGDEVVTGAILHLIYSYSPALLPNISQLKVLVNGEVAATLPVPHEQAGMLVARDVSIDPRFITEFNHLNVQLIGHYTQQCEDPANSTLWATVSNASSLDLTYASLDQQAGSRRVAAAFLRSPRRAPSRTAVRVPQKPSPPRSKRRASSRRGSARSPAIAARCFRRRSTTCRCRATPWCSPPPTSGRPA